MDDPTAGLDPNERVRFRNIISSLGKNRMVLLSTHIVSDLEYIADTILIMKKGELIISGTESQIIQKVDGLVWKCVISEQEMKRINAEYIISNFRNIGEEIELRIVSEKKPTDGAISVQATLEDAYLYHTRKSGGQPYATL